MITELPYSAWNVTVPEHEELYGEAAEEDYVLHIDGFFFLIQRKNECNNILCFRYSKEGTFLKAITQLVEWCKEHSIQYIRVEGNTKRYFFLAKTGLGEVIKDADIKDRNVFYCKLY